MGDGSYGRQLGRVSSAFLGIVGWVVLARPKPLVRRASPAQNAHMTPNPLDRLRELCLALPEAREVEAWGEPTFRVKTIFAMYAGPENHHGAGRSSAWVKASPTNQDLLVSASPDQFFVPPYVGPKGWIGVYLDGPEVDWEHLAELLQDAWRMSSPKKLVARYSDSL